jgi:imidazolonepropionase-like amidohydrolase
MGALIDEAHRQGLKAYAHAPILHYAKEALRAGADGLVHGVLSDPVDDEFIELMRRNGAVYVSTQSLYVCFNDAAAWLDRLERFDSEDLVPPEIFAALRSAVEASPFRVSDEDLAHSFENLARVHQAGIPVVAGTDSGVLGVVLGPSSPIEVALLVEAGIPPADALKSATIRAAAMVGLESELGTIEAGKRADLVILHADPLENIANLARIAGVVRGGVVYGDPGELGHAAAQSFPGEKPGAD